jgi:hypothetical protein
MSAQGILAFLCLLIGSVIYSRFIQGTNFLRIFFICQLALAATSLLEVLLVSRLNLALGLPDTVFVLGSGALHVVISRLTMQPFYVIAGRLCPPGVEASLYAAFMSVHNLGHAASGMFGAAILPFFGVEKGAYQGLPALLLLRSACMLLPLVLMRPLLGGAVMAVAKEKAD